MSKVILEGYIDVPKDVLDLVRSELLIHIELTRKESGCLVFRVEQDQECETRFNVYEMYEDQKAFEFHQERIKGSRWASVTKNVQRNYRIRRA